MDEWTKNVIYYPMVKHPLYDEKDELKGKYIALVNKYAEDINEEFTDLKLKVLYKVLYGKDDFDGTVERVHYSKGVEAAILKTRFSPFRFFSYRYVFLFDVLLLFAADNREKGLLICEEFKRHVHVRYHKKIDMMISLMYEDKESFAEKTLITNEMIQCWLDIRHYLKTDNREIIFTATMSAGKSTLINAIIGNNLSGTKKAACTSVVIKFHSTPAKGELYNFSDETKQCYCQTVSNIQQVVRDEKVNYEITGYFNSLLSGERFTLIDTPGVDSKLYPEHKKATKKALVEKEIETLVYVIPVETYGSDRDANHLNFIAKKVSYRKIIFVINMMDTIDEEDDSVEDIVADVKNHLEDLGFENPAVYPVSAKAGLQLKQALVGMQLSANEEDSKREYCRLFLKPEYGLAKYYPSISEEEKDFLLKKYYRNYNDSLWEAFINTGLPGLERVLFNANRKDGEII